jgi:hypothetical protein
VLTHFPTDACERSTRTPRGDARRTASVTAIQGRIQAGDGVGRVHASKMLRAAYMREPAKRFHVELHDALFSKSPRGRSPTIRGRTRRPGPPPDSAGKYYFTCA